MVSLTNKIIPNPTRLNTVASNVSFGTIPASPVTEKQGGKVASMDDGMRYLCK
jgi:hypothetical protein